MTDRGTSDQEQALIDENAQLRIELRRAQEREAQLKTELATAYRERDASIKELSEQRNDLRDALIASVEWIKAWLTWKPNVPTPKPIIDKARVALAKLESKPTDDLNAIDKPIATICTRTSGHEGPCNGYPRTDCFISEIKIWPNE